MIMKQKLLKSMLLLCVLVLGGVGKLWATGYEELFTIKSSDVVTYSSYAAYNTTVSFRDFVITFGGNNKSVGTNSGNRSKCILSGYSKYAVPPVTASSIASAFACKTSISDVSKISYTFNGGSNQTNTKVYLLYSSDNSSFSQVSLTSGTQGAAISSGTAYEFEAKTGYFALLFEATNSSDSWRIDDVNVTFYKEASGGGSDPSISLSSNTIEATEAAKEGTINVTYNNLTDYASEVIFYESNGTTPATYDHSWLTAGINSTTKNLEYSITANTGAARTAYMRVYVVDNTLGELYSPVITVTQAAKTVEKPTFNLEGGSYMQGTNITISSAGNTVYYNMTTDGSTPATPTKASTEYSAPIVLGSGTTKITAIAYDTYGNESGTTTRTYTGIATATLPFGWTGTDTKGKDELAKETGVAVSLGSNYASSNAPYRLKFDGTSRYITIYTDVRPEVVTFTVKLFNAANTGSKLKVQGSADGITYADIEEFTIKGAANETFEFTTSNAFAENHRAVKLVMSSKDQNVGVGTICINCIPATLNADGYATFASSYPLDFTNSNIKAYIATEAEGSAVNLSAVNKVPANTGVVLNYSGEITENIPVFDGTSADDVAGNCLLVSDGTVKGGTGIYALANKNHGIGFYLVNNSVTIPKGKAYLQTGANTKEFLNFDFSDDETGINTVNGSELMVNSSIYNLSGQRISKLQKGVNIVNGKKVLF